MKKNKVFHFIERYYRSNLSSRAFENLVRDIIGINENIQFEHVPEKDNAMAYTDVTFLRDENEHNDNFEKQLQKHVEYIHRELNRLSLLKTDFERYIKV